MYLYPATLKDTMYSSFYKYKAFFTNCGFSMTELEAEPLSNPWNEFPPGTPSMVDFPKLS